MSSDNGHSDSIHYTAIESRIVLLLSDGLPHHRQDVLECLGDSQATLNNLQKHISNIRHKLRPRGHDIICEIYRSKVHYRHIRLLNTRD